MYGTKPEVMKFNMNGNIVNVYDGDVDYVQRSAYKNPSYYNKNGKRVMTTPYSQWSGMISRCTEGSAMRKQRYNTYVGCTHSELFKDFDAWMDWAENQHGFMWRDQFGKVFALDKDVKFRDDLGKHYSEDTCSFIPSGYNTKVTAFTEKGRLSLVDSIFDDFTEINESLIEFIFGFDLTLSRRVPDSVEYVEEFEDFHKIAGMILAVAKSKKPMASISFVDGVYRVRMNRLGVKVSQDFTDVTEAVKFKYQTNIGLMERGYEDILKMRYSDGRLSEALLCIKDYKAEYESVLSGEIKLKKYILVDI